VSHVYAQVGVYTATLVVTDNHGLEDADTVTITVVPPFDGGPPDGQATGDGSVVLDHGPATPDTAVADRGDRTPTSTADGCSCASGPSRLASGWILVLLLLPWCFRARRLWP